MFKYLDNEMEREKAEEEREQLKLYIIYLSQIFSQPLHEKPSPKFMQAKKEFEKMITPEDNSRPRKPAKVYEWDFERKARLQNSNAGRG